MALRFCAAMGSAAFMLVCGSATLLVCGSAAMAESGIASVYGYNGSKTASGERANPTGYTAAHRTLPFGTKVRVTNKRNGKSVVVRINDRGPFIRGRVIDLTPAGARAIGFSGLAPVTLERAGTTAEIGGGLFSFASASSSSNEKYSVNRVATKD